MTLIIRTCFLGCLCLMPLLSFGQYHLEVAGISLTDSTQTIDLRIKLTEEGVTAGIQKTELEVYERIGNSKDSSRLNINTLLPREFYSKQTAELEQFVVLILLDLSTDISSEDYQRGLELAETFITKTALAEGSQYYISTFNGTISDTLPFQKNEVKQVLNSFERSSEHSELYSALYQNLRYFRQEDRKKVVLLLTDGRDKPNLDNYRTKIPYDESDINSLITSLDPSFSIYPIGLGDTQEPFLQLLVNSTNNAQDEYALNQIPPSLDSLVTGYLELEANYVVQLIPRPGRECFIGKPRYYTVNWRSVGVTDYYFASDFVKLYRSTNPKCLDSPTANNYLRWLTQFLLGVVLVFGLLGILNVSVPAVTRRNFERKYVSPYRRTPGVREIDPVTGDDFEEGDMVVHRCRQKMLWDTWKGMGNRCINYPKCMDWNNRCDGAGKPMGDERFFSMNGVFRQLNWLWFGILGGFIAWVIFALFKSINFEWYQKIIANIYNKFDSQASGASSSAITESATTLADETLLGVAFGMGICFTLSWMEERTQPRKISWGRILFRTFLGLVISIVIFIVGFNLQYTGIVSNTILSGLITWLLFGITVGFVLSVGSSISFSRALIGGVVAALVGYGIYTLVSMIFQDYTLAKLIAFILLGGTLGIILDTVVSSLEDFELEYITPVEFAGTNRISKWLKAGLEIYIGRQPGSTVYVKWEDEHVAPQHAKLSYSNGVVYIEPLEETLVNNRRVPIGKKTALEHEDMIQLGRFSHSRMRYVEKRQS